ncbi:MAG: hypothetical protein IH987_09120 [Planctomycetes bacterium]|nr:hypothetical protein [Planctomycetota bacterium]
MNTKKWTQVLLLAVAIVYGFSLAYGIRNNGGGSEDPPSWIKSIGSWDLLGPETLSRNELTNKRGGATFPEKLTLMKNLSATYNIAAGSAKIRKLIISVKKSISTNIKMVYTPAEGEKQEWPGNSDKADEVTFIVDDQGGTIKFTNNTQGSAKLRIVE